MAASGATISFQTSTSQTDTSTNGSTLSTSSSESTAPVTESSSVQSSTAGSTTVTMQSTSESTSKAPATTKSTVAASTGTISSSAPSTVVTTETSHSETMTPITTSSNTVSETSSSTLLSSPTTQSTGKTSVSTVGGSTTTPAVTTSTNVPVSSHSTGQATESSTVSTSSSTGSTGQNTSPVSTSTGSFTSGSSGPTATAGSSVTTSQSTTVSGSSTSPAGTSTSTSTLPSASTSPTATTSVGTSTTAGSTTPGSNVATSSSVRVSSTQSTSPVVTSSTPAINTMAASGATISFQPSTSQTDTSTKGSTLSTSSSGSTTPVRESSSVQSSTAGSTTVTMQSTSESTSKAPATTKSTVAASTGTISSSAPNTVVTTETSHSATMTPITTLSNTVSETSSSTLLSSPTTQSTGKTSGSTVGGSTTIPAVTTSTNVPVSSHSTGQVTESSTASTSSSTGSTGQNTSPVSTTTGSFTSGSSGPTATTGSSVTKSQSTSQSTTVTETSTSPAGISTSTSTLTSASTSATATTSVGGSSTAGSTTPGSNVATSSSVRVSSTQSSSPVITSSSPAINTMAGSGATTSFQPSTSLTDTSTKGSSLSTSSSGSIVPVTENSFESSKTSPMLGTNSPLSTSVDITSTSDGSITPRTSPDLAIATQSTTDSPRQSTTSLQGPGNQTSARLTSPGTTMSATTTSAILSNIFTILLDKTDDGTSVEIPVSGSIPVYGSRFKLIHVSVNGLVSLGNNTVGYNPRPLPIGASNTVLLAPFWTDFDIRNTTDSSVYATVYENVQNSTNITQEWLSHFEPGFNPTWAIDVHWNHVTPYPAEIYHGKENTSFRLVLFSDGDRTVAVYDYDQNNTLPYSLARTPVIGLDFGSDGYNAFFNSSGTPQAVDVSTTLGNIGLIGKWLFKLYNESTVSNDTATCRDWLTRESRDNVTSSIPACPCSTAQIFADPNFYFDNATFCADLVSPTINGHGLHCCYNPTDTPVKGSLLTGPRGPTAFYRYHPESFPALHQSRDIGARDACCSDEYTCQQYYALRAVSSCSKYNPPIIASVFGSPNLQTFDGLEYTFSGNGTYLLAETTTGSVLHSQMEPIWLGGDPNQANSSLTTFTSYRFIGDTNVTVSQNDKRTGLEISVGGVSITKRFKRNSRFRERRKNLTIYRDNEDCVALVETSGFSTTFCDTDGSISAVVVTPPEVVRNTSGLLGTANNNTSDDFSMRGKIVQPLPLNSTDREIFTQMHSWRVSSDNTTSMPQNLTINVTYTTPFFLDELYPNIYNDMNSTEYNACVMADSTLSKACLYQRLVLKDETAANQALVLANTIADQKHVLKTQIPPLEASGSRIVNVTVGTEVTLYLRHVPSVTVRCNTEVNATCINNGTFAIFTWTPVSLETVHLSFTGVENNTGLVSETLEYEIQICDCSGNGKCRFDRLLPSVQPTDNFRLASCQCDIGWTGQHCELDFDGCQGAPCVSWGSNCTDLSPLEQRNQKHPYMCSYCPEGYRTSSLGGCFDINECLENTTICDNEPGICINTNGNYTCQCPRSTVWNGSVCNPVPKPTTLIPASTTERSQVDICGYHNGTQLCQNNGTCQLQNTNDSICVCTSGYYGDLCELSAATKATEGDWVVEILLPAAAALAIAAAALCCIMAVVRRRRKKRSLDEESDQDSYGIRGSYAVPSSIFLPRFNTNWRQFYGSPSTWNDTAPTVHRDRPLQFPISYPYDNETNSSDPGNSFDDPSLDTTPEWCNNVLLQEEEFNIGRPIYKTERIYPHLPDDSY